MEHHPYINVFQVLILKLTIKLLVGNAHLKKSPVCFYLLSQHPHIKKILLTILMLGQKTIDLAKINKASFCKELHINNFK